MYDPELEALVGKPDAFVPQEKYQYIDATCIWPNIPTKFETGDQGEEWICNWLRQEPAPANDDGQLQCHFKLLVLDFEQWPGTRIPCSKIMWHALDKAWDAGLALKIFHRGAYHSTLMNDQPSLKQTSRFGLVAGFRPDVQVAAHYDVARKTTMAIIMTRPPGHEQGRRIILQLERHHSAIGIPQLCLLLAQENEVSYLEGLASSQQAALRIIQGEMDIDIYRGTPASIDANPDDLVQTTLKIAKVQERLNSLVQSTSLTTDHGALLEQLQKLFRDSLTSVERGEMLPELQAVQGRLGLANSRTENLMKYTAHLQRGAQTTTATISTLLGSHDSSLNYESAQASLRVAEESRQMAVLARQDSADMRIIAATTLLFLPATFVATFFSTTFFNFQPENNLVSGWIWLYWVVTAALTVLVMGAWRFVSRARLEDPSGAELTDLRKRPSRWKKTKIKKPFVEA